MSIFAFSKKPVKKVGLVLDIGSKTVGGAVFEKDPDGNIKLIYTAREQIAFQKILTGENLMVAMLRSLGLVLVHIERYGLEHLKQTTKMPYLVETADVVISSPWHISETKNLKITQEKPFTVTEDLVDNLITKEETDFIQGLPGGKRGESNLALLEHKIVEMQLNGYPVTNPYGKKTSELDLHIFTSVAPKHVIKKIQTLIHRYFPMQHLEFHTFSLVAFASIRDFFPDMEHFLVVQIGGEVTDITLVKKGVITETVSFPMGHNNLMHALDRICKNHPECTLGSLLTLHREAKAISSDKHKVERAIEETKTSWLELFNNAASNLSAETFLPQNVFLFEDGSYISLFGEFIKEAESSQLTISTKPFVVKTSSELEKVLTESGLPLSADAILAMEASFIARFES